MSRKLAAAIGTLVLAACVTSARADVNAWLTLGTSQADTVVTEETGFPVPVYIALEGADSAVAIGLELKWADTQVGPRCHRIIPTTYSTVNGYLTPADVWISHFGTIDYAWRIVFPGPARDRIELAVDYDACAFSAPSTLILAHVYLEQPSGHIDSLAMANTITFPAAVTDTPAVRPAYASTQCILITKPDAVQLGEGQTTCTISSTTVPSATMRATLQAVGITEMRLAVPTATEDNLASEDSPTLVGASEVLRMFVAALPDTGVIAAVATLRADTANVEYAQPDWLLHLDSRATDALVPKEWWLENIGQFKPAMVMTPGVDLNTTMAWECVDPATAEPVDVVVIDTGCDDQHPDLVDRVTLGPHYVGTSAKDDDPYSHGTSVAGIIGAKGNGGGDVAGLHWRANIVAVKACGSDETCTSSNVMAAIDWARVNGYKVVNLSLSGTEWSRAFDNVCRTAWIQGVTLVSSVGNRHSLSEHMTHYPAGYAPYTFGIGAFSADGLKRWWDGNVAWSIYPPQYPMGTEYGPDMDLMAPGGRGIETIARSDQTNPILPQNYQPLFPSSGSYGFGGTSAATAVASGAMAWSMGGLTGLTADDAAQILEHEATEIGTGERCLNLWAVGKRIGHPALLRHGLATGGTVVQTVSSQDVYMWSWPNINTARYPAELKIVQKTVVFDDAFPGLQFADMPFVWLRQSASMGAGNRPIDHDVFWQISSGSSLSSDYESWYPEVRVVATSATSVTFETYVYDLKNLIGGGHYAWFPCAPSDVAFSYGIAGPNGASAVPSSGPGALSLAISGSAGGERSVIRYTLPAKTDVQLAVVDVAGRVVWEMGKAVQAAGEHLVEWRRDRVANGMYFVRLRTGSGTKTVKYVALK